MRGVRTMRESSEQPDKQAADLQIRQAQLENKIARMEAKFIYKDTVEMMRRLANGDVSKSQSMLYGLITMATDSSRWPIPT
jgi:hypothetical protein